MLYGNKIEVWVRDLTIANSVSDVSADLRLELPDENLEEKLNKEHEYIIIDAEAEFQELDNVFDINDFFLETDCNRDDFIILTKLYRFPFLKEAIKEGHVSIYCFENETASWNYGEGVFPDEWWKGYFLHEVVGWRFDWEKLSSHHEFLHGDWFREKVKEMEDYINYEYLYTQAQTEGLHEVDYNGKLYFVF